MEAELTVPGTTVFADRRLEAHIIENTEIGGASILADSSTVYLSLDAIDPPLVLRRPVPGDRFQPFGMMGSKKLSDLFIDNKIPGRERERALVLADKKDILWVLGVATSEKTRITGKTKKILKIAVKQE
jgi:tRNA(Ile)-lysidine synthase